jgi:very-short-patch-repair endonuclease
MGKTNTEPAYLTQSKLTAMLSKYFEVSTEVKVGDTRLRSDIQFTHNNVKYAVEFDEDSHYCNSDVIENDIRKNDILKSSGFNLVRIPYWLQLNDYVFDSCFGFSYPEPIPQTYPHGFIDKKLRLQHFIVLKDYYVLIRNWVHV